VPTNNLHKIYNLKRRLGFGYISIRYVFDIPR